MGKLRKFSFVAIAIVSAFGLAAYPYHKTYATVPGDNTLVSMNYGNTEGASNNYGSGSVSLSTDGRYVAFSSDATDLVSGDTNSRTDIFVRDMNNNTTQRVSLSTSGGQLSYASYEPHISGNGKYVVYETGNSNPSAENVYEYNMSTGTTTLVSVDSNGDPGANFSGADGVSNDGRFVLFTSGDTNLIPGMTTSNGDVFVRDMDLSTTTLISKSAAGAEGNNGSGDASMSCDGALIEFSSQATNLVSGDTNGYGDVFLDNRVGGDRLTDVTKNANNDSSTGLTSISCDGDYLAFNSYATNLVSGITNGDNNAFVYDRTGDSFDLANVDSSGDQANSYAMNIEVSDGGRYVAFLSDATNLVSADTGGKVQAYLHDRQAGTTELLSQDSSGDAGDWPTGAVALSADGTKAALYSHAYDLQDTYFTPSQWDVYLASTH